MIFNLSNQYDIPKFREYAQRLQDQGCVVTLSRKVEGRSSAQNRYLHLILGWFGCEYGASVEEVKVDYFKRHVNAEIFVRVKTNKYGKEIKYLRSSADLTTEEMSLAIERFRNWSASVAGIYLPSANEQEFLRHVETEIAKNSAYL